MMNALILLFLGLSLVFLGLALIGAHKPRLAWASSRRKALFRWSLLSLLSYVLMAILLSVKVIDQRGYDARFAQLGEVLSREASASPVLRANVDADGKPFVRPEHYS